MSQTTMKIDRDVLIDLRKLASDANRSPQKHLRFLVEREKSKLIALNSKPVLATDQQKRADIVADIEESTALEGYAPETAGFVYDLNQKWISGEVTLVEKGRLLAAHYGVEYSE